MAPVAVTPIRQIARRHWIMAGGLLLALMSWASQGWQRAATERQTTNDRIADVRQLARSQVAALSDRLEKQPGTVRLRAGLAREAATVLARVAALPDAPPQLRLEAAEAYRRLAGVQSAVDRPSLRDRPAARASLDVGLRLIAADTSAAARPVRARILIDAARQAAADGALSKAPAMLAQARAAAGTPGPVIADELALAESEIAQWQGDYPRAIAAAERVARPISADPAAWRRQLRARDLAAEARFYAGDKAGALAGYRTAVALAEAGMARFPDEPALRWAVQRQQWNIGSTLVDMGQATSALPLLVASRAGWMAMARADPEDESLAFWVQVTRLSYGAGLAAAGRRTDAIAELSQTLADRRAWAARRPGNAERQRALLVGLTALGEVLGEAGRRGEACGLFGEAVTVVRAMARTGGLTRLDRDSQVKLLGAGISLHCPVGGAGLQLPA